MKIKHYDDLKELVEHEIEDYCGLELIGIETDDDYENDDEEEYYVVKIKDKNIKEDDQEVWLSFKCTDEGIFINMWEDEYEKVEYFDWTIKYFWMKLLWRD